MEIKDNNLKYLCEYKIQNASRPFGTLRSKYLLLLYLPVFGLLHELKKLVVIHELIEFGPIDQIDNLLRNDLCHKELSDEVHVTQHL